MVREDFRARSSQLNQCAATALLVLIVLASGCGGSTPEKQAARFLNRGKALIEKSDYARAVVEFKNAARLVPKDPEPSYRLGLAYLSLGDYQNGVGYLLHATALAPKHASAQLKVAEWIEG